MNYLSAVSEANIDKIDRRGWGFWDKYEYLKMCRSAVLDVNGTTVMSEDMSDVVNLITSKEASEELTKEEELGCMIPRSE